MLAKIICVVEWGCKAYIASYAIKEKYIDSEINTTYVPFFSNFFSLTFIELKKREY